MKRRLKAGAQRIVAESFMGVYGPGQSEEPFTEEDLAAAGAVAARHAANIDLSVLFAGLRERAGLEEFYRRARLAGLIDQAGGTLSATPLGRVCATTALKVPTWTAISALPWATQLPSASCSALEKSRL